MKKNDIVDNLDNPKELVGNLIVIDTDLRGISGTVSREEGESEAVFTNGGIRYISPERLKIFNTLRARMSRTCAVRGVRFLSGWAIAESDKAAIVSELAPVIQDAEDAISDFVANFEAYKKEWSAEHPEVIPHESRFPTAAWVKERLGVRISIYRVSSESDDPGRDGVLAELGELPRRVLEEIAQDVRNTWKPKTGDNAGGSARTLRLLKRIQEKLFTLAFLGGNLGQAANYLKAAIDRFPAAGRIEGPDYLALVAIMDLLSDAEKMAAMGQQLDLDTFWSHDDGQESLDLAADESDSTSLAAVAKQTLAEEAEAAAKAEAERQARRNKDLVTEDVSASWSW